jgi:hypothetical protein
MPAELLDILARRRPSPIGLVEPTDFTVSPAGPADPALVLRPEASLYCLDDRGRRAFFVECDAGVDLAAAPFYYQAQFEHARRLIALPYDDVHRVAATLEDPADRLVLLYSTGRCGSTLLSRAFAHVPGVVSLSEPDALTQLVALRPTDGSRDPQIQSLAAACVRLLCKPGGPGCPGNAGSRWVIKFRSMGIELADLLHRAFPGARPMFLYRDAEAVVESSLPSSADAPAAPDVNTPVGRELAERYVSWARGGPLRQLLRAAAGGFDAAVTRGDFRVFRRIARAAIHLGREQPTMEELYAVLWVSVVARYVELLGRGVVPDAFRYVTLVEHPRETLEAVFTHAGLPPAAAAGAAAAVMVRDSQAGSARARERTRAAGDGAARRKQAHDAAFTLTAMDRRIRTPGFIAPGTFVPPTVSPA